MTKYYFVSSGVNASHANDTNKMFNTLRDAISCFDSLSESYKEIRNNENRLEKLSINDVEIKRYKLESFGTAFYGNTRKELMNEVKAFMYEYDISLDETDEFTLYGTIERDCTKESDSFKQILNDSLKKAYQLV